MKKVILLTGGTGFLGTILIKKLVKLNISFLVIGRGSANKTLKQRILEKVDPLGSNFIEKECYFLETDLNNPEKVINYIEKERLQIYHLLHIAANISFRPEEYQKVVEENLNTTKTMCTIANFLKCPFLFISTAFVHGPRLGTLYETELIRPNKFNNGYEESKFLCEEFIHSNATVPTNILRPGILISNHEAFGTFGFYVLMKGILKLKNTVTIQISKNPKIYSKLGISIIGNKLTIPVPFLYSKKSKMDFVTPEIVCDVIIYSIKNIEPDIKINTVQISNPQPQSTGEILRQLLKGAEVEMPIIGVNKNIAKLYIKMIGLISFFVPMLKSFYRKINAYCFFITEEYIHDTKSLKKIVEKENLEVLPENIFEEVTKKYIRESSN